MIVVEQQTWMAFLGVAGFFLALMGYLANMKRDLKSDIGRVRTDLGDTRRELKADIADTRRELKAEIADTRTELKAEISDTRTDLKADIRRLDSRLVTLENRTYDISARLPPAPATSSPQAS